MAEVKIESSWKHLLDDVFLTPYFAEIKQSLKDRKQKGEIIYPPGPMIFKAFDLTPVHHVKVVILGQDPYHNEGEAMGLSFSVPKGVRVPPSLKNIYKEIIQDVGGTSPSHGDLTAWAQQGVLMLNAVLTVAKNSAGSHRNIGWSHFTDVVIERLAKSSENIVFMLWGNFAKEKVKLIPEGKHLVLTAAHPSPLAGGAFFGCKHFSKANEYLVSKGKSPIDWQVD